MVDIILKWFNLASSSITLALYIYVQNDIELGILSIMSFLIFRYYDDKINRKNDRNDRKDRNDRNDERKMLR